MGQYGSSMVRRKRLLARSLAAVGFVSLTLLGAGGWWYMTTRTARSASGSDLGRATGGVEAAGLNLLVITLDTTRADRVGAYGFKNVETPAIDRLAREGVVFEHTMAVGTADAAGARQHLHRPLPSRARGARQRGVLPVAQAADARRRAQDERCPHRRRRRRVRPGRQVGTQPGVRDLRGPVRAARSPGLQHRRGAAARQTRWWTARFRGWRRSRASGSSRGCTSTIPMRPTNRRSRSRPATPSTPTSARSPSSIPRSPAIVEFLERNALLEKTVVAVIGDHGESLNQHGEGTHGFFVYEATTRVPFIIRAPFERRPGPARGRPRPGRGPDADRARSARHRPAEGDRGRQPRAADDRSRAAHGPRGVRRGDVPAAPLRLERHARLAGRPLQGDRRAAPRALRPRARSARDDEPLRRPAVGGRRDDRPAARAWREASAGDDSVAKPAPEVDTETRARLAALGYVGSFVATIASPKTDRADPKDKIELFNLMVDAREGRHDDKNSVESIERAISLYERVVAARPERHRRLVQPGEPERAAASFPGSDSVLQEGARAEARLRPAGRQHGERLPPDGAGRGRPGRIRALPDDRPEERARALPDGRDLPRQERPRAGRAELQAGRRDQPARGRGAQRARCDGVSARRPGGGRARDPRRRSTSRRPSGSPTTTSRSSRRSETTSRRPRPSTAANWSCTRPPSRRRSTSPGSTNARETGSAQIASLEAGDRRGRADFAEGKIFLAKAYLDAGTNFAEAIELARQGLTHQPPPDIAALGHLRARRPLQSRRPPAGCRARSGSRTPAEPAGEMNRKSESGIQKLEAGSPP